jgi:hypothetical protein
VDWKKTTFAEAQALLVKHVPGIPADAVRPLAAALFMCIPLPPAWAQALTKLRALREFTDHPEALDIIDDFEAVYAEERDRLWRTYGDLRFAPFAVWREKPISTRSRRRILVFLGAELLRAAGLPLESTSSAGAFDLVADVLRYFWPRETGGAPDPESVERAYYRGKDEYESTTFEPPPPKPSRHERLARAITARAAVEGVTITAARADEIAADVIADERALATSPLAPTDVAGQPTPAPPEPAPTAPRSRYPTPEEFRFYVAPVYLDHDVAWFPVPDSRN